MGLLGLAWVPPNVGPCCLAQPWPLERHLAVEFCLQVASVLCLDRRWPIGDVMSSSLERPPLGLWGLGWPCSYS